MFVSEKPLALLVLGTTLLLSTFTAQADRLYLTYYGDDCLSWYGIYRLTRQALPELQALDPSVTLREVIITVKSSGICVTSEQAQAIIADYADQLAASAEPVNTPPLISGIASGYGAEGSTYSFAPSASDPDNDSLTFQITNRPGWANFDTATGILSGTPDYTDAGNYANIVISVSDGQASASLSAFSITVSDTNRAPTINGMPAVTVLENSRYSFAPSATDVDGDRLNFSISGTPAWASFDPGNGTLVGTPDYDDAGSYDNIVISVSDGKSSASLPAFSIVVDNANRLPTIGGDPIASVTVGEVYSFTPYASDPDGDELVFSVSNLPTWASFDLLTGTLSGSPATDDIGIYEDILIGVSDGSAAEVTLAMAITVDGVQEPSGTATLSWEIPTTRADGTPLALSEIEGYRLYMGSTSTDLVMIVDLNDSAQTRYLVNGLASGSYFFSVTTYDTDGNESTYSNIAATEIL